MFCSAATAMTISTAGTGADVLDGSYGYDFLQGGPGADVLSGGTGRDKLEGGYGNDHLAGNAGRDALYGGPGNDVLYGGAAADLLTGGAGRDVFQYKNISDSRASTGIDLIRDFNSAQNDKIDIHLIDGTSPTFIGDHPFTSVAGQVNYRIFGGNTFVSGDRNGDGRADYTIELSGVHRLKAGDFDL